MTDDLQEQRIWAQTLLENGRFGEAADIYRKLATVAPNQADLSNLGIAHAWQEREFAQKLLGWMPGDLEVRRFLISTLMRNAFHKDVAGYCSEWIPTAEEPFLTWLRLTRIEAEALGAVEEPNWDDDVPALLAAHDDKPFIRGQLCRRVLLIQSATAIPHLEALTADACIDATMAEVLGAKIQELRILGRL